MWVDMSYTDAKENEELWVTKDDKQSIDLFFNFFSLDVNHFIVVIMDSSLSPNT